MQLKSDNGALVSVLLVDLVIFVQNIEENTPSTFSFSAQTSVYSVGQNACLIE